MEEVLVRIGKRLYKRRKEMRLTQEKMAELLEMSASFYRAIERGRKHISIEKILLVYERTGLSPDYLLPGKTCRIRPLWKFSKTALKRNSRRWSRFWRI